MSKKVDFDFLKAIEQHKTECQRQRGSKKKHQAVLPPSDNMGALSTQPNNEFDQLTLTDIQNLTHNHMLVSFDWLEFTIKTDDWKLVIIDILDLDPAEFTLLETGGRGYKQSLLWNMGNVRIFESVS